MASILTDAQKGALSTSFADLVDTFVRPITVWHEAERVVIKTNPNYSRLNRFNQNSTSVENTPVETTLQARVFYPDVRNNLDNKFAEIGGTPQNKIKITDGTVRIKVDGSGFDFIGEGKKIEVDNVKYDIDSVGRPQGLFTGEYYTYWLKRSQ